MSLFFFKITIIIQWGENMHSLLIVDDEILELETLRDYVDWDSYNISVIATAKNGKSAFNIALEHNPDIIITDIKMPIMDGIEFSRKLRESNITSKLIFLTGYDDFNYAKSAINVHASGYILKPFSIDELHDVINCVNKELEADELRINSTRIFVENRFKLLLNSQESDDCKKITDELSKIQNYDFVNNTYNIMLVYSDAKPVIHCREYIYSLDEYAQIIPNDSYCTVIILNSNINKNMNIEQISKKIQSNLLLNDANFTSIIYSNLVHKFNDLGNIYIQLMNLEENLFYIGKNSILNASTVTESLSEAIKLPSIESKLAESLFTYEKDKVQQVMSEYFDFIINNKVSKPMLLESLFNLLLYVWENFFNHNPDINPEIISKNELWNELLECKDINDAYNFVKEHVDRVAQYLIEKQKDKNQQVVDKVMKFIEKNFGNQITISDVAKDIYLSPNYIRNIFKEKTGITFLEYLVSYRMKKASELLKDKSLKVHEISNKVGYENVSYFCSVFAKHYGVSPNEYRNKY